MKETLSRGNDEADVLNVNVDNSIVNHFDADCPDWLRQVLVTSFSKIVLKLWRRVPYFWPV